METEKKVLDQTLQKYNNGLFNVNTRIIKKFVL